LKTCLKTGFYQDILFFEKEFEGIMPLEITVDTKRKKGYETLTLRKMDELQKTIEKYLNFQNRSPFLI
jgi:hypothetical protein